MNILAKPFHSDKIIISGESAAIGPGLLSKIMTDNKFKDLCRGLKLNSDSVVLFFSTEGDTDPEMYKQITQNPEFCLSSF